MKKLVGLIAAGCASALLASASLAAVPTFTEDFESYAPASIPADSAFLNFTNTAAVSIQTGADGNNTNYYGYNNGNNMDVSIIGSHGSDDFNLKFAMNPAGDLWNQDFELPGDGTPNGNDFIHIGISGSGHLMGTVNGNGNSDQTDFGQIAGVTGFNQWVNVRVLRVGNNLKLRAWDYGTAEDTSGWMGDITIPDGVADGANVLSWRWNSVALDDISSDPIPGVPEPASLSILGLGALTMLRRRRA